MEINSIISPLIFVIISLIGGGILKHVLKRTPFPYTVGLFIFGLGAGLLARFGYLSSLEFVDQSIRSISNASPDMILYLFLPILIFDAAYELDVHIFKKNLGNATLLAGPGMVVAMFLTGAMMIYLGTRVDSYANWDWTYALMFGALISATDPVAVVALLKELNVSKRFSTLVDAESMLNDGTGIVLFMIFFGAFTASGAVDSPIIDFMFVVFGGAIIGGIVAFLCLSFITKVNGDKMIQNSTIIVSAYLVFLLAQQYMNVSGVIALVAFGLAISYYGRLKLKPQVTTFMTEFWELAAHLGNTLIFIIVGVVIALKTDFTWESFIVLGCVYVGLNIIRAIMILLFYPIIKRFGYGLSLRESVILTWGGLRGALGLTLALMVSYAPGIPEDVRHQILFQTAGIVTLTLTINATTTGWLLKKLGLRQEPHARQLLELSVKKQIQDEVRVYCEELKKKKALEGTDWTLLEEYIPQAPDVITGDVTATNLLTNIRIRVARKQKLYAWELYNEGVISSRTVKKLTSLADDIYDADGKILLTQQGELFENLKKPTRLLWMVAPDWYRHFLDRVYPGKTISRYDLTRGFLLTQQAALKMVEEYGNSQVFTDEEKTQITLVCQEIASNQEEAEKFMVRLASRHPVNFQKAITLKAIRMLIYKEKSVIQRMAHEGFISDSEAEALIGDIKPI